MTEGTPNLHWPGANDKAVVEEMLRDHQSRQWYECNEFVKKRVYGQAKNIPQDRRDDIVQEVMIRVKKYLPTFRYDCLLTTWIAPMILSCIIDEHRRSAYEKLVISLDDSHNEGEHESEGLVVPASQTVEEESIVHEEFASALLALEEYVASHANSERNRQILDMVLLEGRSQEEAARAVGCSAPVAGYVVRSAQQYVREKLGHHRRR